jgi:hypothetical protein
MNVFTARKKYIIISLAVFAANYALDRLTKIIAVLYLKDRSPVRLLKETVILF